MLCINQLLPSLQQFHSYRLPKRCRPAIARGHHSKGPLWYRVRVGLGFGLGLELAIGGPSLWQPQTTKEAYYATAVNDSNHIYTTIDFITVAGSNQAMDDAHQEWCGLYKLSFLVLYKLI